MANQEHINKFNEGVAAWNQWRTERGDLRPDLSLSHISYRSLADAYVGLAHLSNKDSSDEDPFDSDLVLKIIDADIVNARLNGINFNNTHLELTYLRGADLTGADLSIADLSQADLCASNLSGADLSFAHLRRTDLSGVNLSNTICQYTTFADVDLRTAIGLETVKHEGPSTIGLDTIIKSQGKIPEIFLRGTGMPQSIIEQIPALIASLGLTQYNSCFISYSSRDETFARRLYADLQAKGVRCWYAPEDLRIGDKFRHRIDEFIRVYDKLLLVLSEASLASTWVGYEVEKAIDKEPEGIPNVLFPIRLDKTILTSETDWAKDIRKSRHIGDFEHWKEHDKYQVAFERLLRDLKAQS